MILCFLLLVLRLFFLIMRRPPRSTPAYTLFPYATLFRSAVAGFGNDVERVEFSGWHSNAQAFVRISPGDGRRLQSIHLRRCAAAGSGAGDRKRTRLNSSH